MNVFGWKVGDQISDAKLGSCLIIAINDEMAKFKDARGKEIDFRFPQLKVQAKKASQTVRNGGRHIDTRVMQPAALGLLASSSCLYAEIHCDKQDAFLDRYGFSDEDNLRFLSVVTGNKWGNEHRIRINASMNVLESVGIERSVIKRSHLEDQVEINNNRLWWKLVDLGFRLGSNHDLDAIRRNIPVGSMDEFERGFGLTVEAAA